MKIRVDWIILEDKGSMDLSPEDLEMSEEEWEELPYDEQQYRLEDYLFNTIGEAIPLVQDFISIDD